MAVTQLVQIIPLPPVAVALAELVEMLLPQQQRAQVVQVQMLIHLGYQLLV